MKIENIRKEIGEKTERIGLTPAEKSTILKKVFGAPLRPVPSSYVSIVNRWRLFSKFSFRYIVALLLFMFAGGSVMAHSSLNALPGDSLYAVKLKIIEPILDIFTFSPISHAKLEADKAIRRLDEADELVSKSNLTVERRIEIEDHFKKNVDDFELEVISIQNQSSSKKNNENQTEKLRTDFNKSLNASADSLRKNGEKLEDKKQRKEVDLLEKTVREKASSNAEKFESKKDK